MSAMRTVLVLHGYSQNANIFSKRLGALRKECGKDFELVFVDAPHILHPVDLVGAASQQSQEAALSAMGASEASLAAADPALTPRGWWRTNRERTVYTGVEESLLVIRDVLKTKRFHGVFGFSQGAAFAALIAALLERPHLYAPFMVDGQPVHPPLEFCVSVSGFRVNDDFARPFFSPPYETPTLHVIGKTDIVVTEERSQQLIEVSANKRVEEHEGGHFVPSKGNWRKFLKNYMLHPLADLPSPGSAGTPLASATNSGTATPLPGATDDPASIQKL
ncbi:hypothetical protein AX16_004467 [Volvariella volvacea WC 439]|nr:hypothetical protein AX16_004467 [Volvariella volvacea WC 439]